MSTAEFAFILPYFISAGLSLGVLAYTWRNRNTPGAQTYMLYVIGQCLWICGYILELLTPDLPGKIFWDKFQWVAGLLILVAFPIFTVQYTKVKIRNSRQLAAASFVVPIIFLLMVLTDGQHRLIYPNPILDRSYLFSELRYDFTWLVYVYSIYSYLVTFTGVGILVKHLTGPHGLYRGQILTVTIGFSIPIFFTILTVAGVDFKPFRDVSPITFGIGNLVVAWGLFRFRTFRVTPIARDHIFEAIIDPVVVLDNHNNIIDINKSMLNLLGMDAGQAVGKPATEVFDDFFIPIKMYAQVSYARAETSFDVQGKTVYYEMTVWPLLNEERKMVGRIYISHDITALKELETDLRELNRDLEERVQMRTQELAEAYDTTLEGWAKALEYRDKETEGHSRRVMDTTLKLARALDVPESELVHIRRGAILHDIGKMAIPDDILRKNGPLTEDELNIVRKHPETALKMLMGIPFLEKALEIPYCHHEKWDGSGYPNGLKEREIPLAARIFAIADVWDALCSDRPYSKSWPRDKAAAYIVEQAGKHFDPEVARVFIELVERDKI